MSDSVVIDCVIGSILKSLLDDQLISKEVLVKNYWQIRNTINPGTRFDQADRSFLDKLGIADTVYGGAYYELGLVAATPDKDLPLIISQLKTEEGKQEVEKRLKSNG